MKIYKIYGGMTGEYEIFRTDAPENVVIEYVWSCANDMLPDNDPNLFFEKRGYKVDFFACQYSDDKEEGLTVDKKIDMYDYFL